MTPLLLGRWETRVVMMATIGVVISAAFAAGLRSNIPFIILGWVVAFGIGWDIVFFLLQKLRWDRDWPAAFAILSGIVEGALIYALIRNTGLPGIHKGAVSTKVFIADYALIWVLAFAWIEGPMKTLTLYWRFHGGRFV